MKPGRRIIRDVKHTATRALNGRQDGVAHKAYMAVTLLEIEKVRREIERDALLTRLDRICARLVALDAEKASLLRGLGPKSRARRNHSPHQTAAVAGCDPTPVGGGGMKFRY